MSTLQGAGERGSGFHMGVAAQGPLLRPSTSPPCSALLSVAFLGGILSLCALQGDRDWILQKEGASQRVLGRDTVLDGVGSSLSFALDGAPLPVPLNLCER